LPEEETNGSTPLTTSKFAGWKTYTNEKYGIELKYPPALLIDQKDLGNIWFWNEQKDPKCNPATMDCIESIKTLGFIVKIQGIRNTDLDQAYKTSPVYKSEPNSFVSTTSLVVAGLQAIENKYCTTGNGFNGCGENKVAIYETFFIKDNNLYSVSSGALDKKVFEQILSSFKFISTSTPANNL
jgi:hypothetical protein